MIKKSNVFIGILITVAIWSHREWFVPFSILTHTDWVWWPESIVKDLWNSTGTWQSYSGLGDANILLHFSPIPFIWSILNSIHIPYVVSLKLTILMPVAIIGFIAPYILSYRFTKNTYIAFTCSLFYASTTYFLNKQTSQITLAAVYALAPIIYYFYLEALEKNKIINWFIFLAIFQIGIMYEIRMMYIVTFFFIFHFLYFHIKEIPKYFKYISITALCLLLLNLYWILPVLKGGISANVAATANRGLFGTELFDVAHAFTISEWTWTGGHPSEDFILHPVLFYLWIIPFIVLWFAAFRNQYLTKKSLFYFLLLIISLLITKETSLPFNNLYEWLYAHFPGFNLFREASKWYIFSSLTYLCLISIILIHLKESKNKIDTKYVYPVFSILIILMACLNIKPLITQEMGTMFIDRQETIPSDYTLVNQFIEQKSGDFRVLWIPTYSRWSYESNEHPRISLEQVLQKQWIQYAHIDNFNPNTENTIVTFLKGTDANSLIDTAGIKYIIIPVRDIQNEDDFFGSNKTRNDYIKLIDTLPFLKKLNLHTKEIQIYENFDYKPHIYTDPSIPLQYQAISSTEYKVQYKTNIPFTLHFTDTYYVNWNIKSKNGSVLSSKVYTQTRSGFNTFVIDPKIMGDEVTLYFMPEQYFHIGIIMSSLTGSIVAGYLIFYFICKKNHEK